MIDFMEQVETSCLQVDYLGVHWYGGINPSGFKTNMQTMYNNYGGTRPLVMAEFSSRLDCDHSGRQQYFASRGLGIHERRIAMA